MPKKFENWSSVNEIDSRISRLLEEGDFHFKLEDYDTASKLFIEYLERLPPDRRLFGKFAKRYYLLKRVCPSTKITEYALEILLTIQKNKLNPQIAFHSKELVKFDLPENYVEEISISTTGKELIQALSNMARFHYLVKLVKELETSNLIELNYLLDHYILNRERTKKTFSFDKYCISIYEKLEKYESALKIAEELLSVHPNDNVVIRSIFRVCRKIKNYERTDDLLTLYPKILKSVDFNVLYELAYYFDDRQNYNLLLDILKRIEKIFPDKIPIQKTLKNLYLRFGFPKDANRIINNLSQLYSTGEKFNTTYLAEFEESDIEASSQMQSLYSELDYQKQLAAISDLTLGFSHEIGQPITNIRYTVQFYRELFKTSMIEEDVFKVFDSILEETKRMGELIKRLSPITSRRNVVERFDLIERIQERIDALSNRLWKYKIELNFLMNTPVNLVGDPIKYEQIINNLILNSIDAIKEKKRRGADSINIQVEEKKDEIIVSFADTGVGIPVKNRSKIFDPFFSTKSPGKGEGLGLFIVWNLLKGQGGRIRLDDNYQNGTRFLISIPKDRLRPKKEEKFYE